MILKFIEAVIHLLGDESYALDGEYNRPYVSSLGF